MSVNLITGYAGKAHITAEGDGAVNAGMYGDGKYVLDVSEKFACEIISNNLIRVKSGYAINQGRKIELAVNDYEEMEIDNGLQGVKRCDLIVIHYSKDMTTGVETATMEVIKGTSGDDYADPSYTSGNIINGASEDDFLLYRVKINGLNIEGVEPLFVITNSIQEQIDRLNSDLTVLNTNLSKIDNWEYILAGKTDGTYTIENITNFKKLYIEFVIANGSVKFPATIERISVGNRYRIAYVADVYADITLNATSIAISISAGAYTGCTVFVSAQR